MTKPTLAAFAALMPSNLGQIIGRLSERQEVPPQPEPGTSGPQRRLKEVGVSGRIRAVLRGAPAPLRACEIASATGLTVVQVASAVVAMPDVERCGVRSKYGYSLKASPA